MKRRWLLLVVMTVSLLLLSACTPSDKTLILAPTPAQTHDAAFDPAIEDIDFASCTEPMELVPFSPYEWELPLEIVPNSMLEEAQLTQPVEIACALINLGGVLFVATDEGGRQFIGGFPLDEWGYERLYTLPEGMRVTSLVQTKEYGRYNETGAFSWTETDGDVWRLRLYDERLREGEDTALLAETTLEQGALSQGSAFLPSQSSAELANDLQTFALLSQPEPVLRTASHGGVTYALPDAQPLCWEGVPVWKVGNWDVVYLEEQDGLTYFCFAAVDEDAQRFAEVFRTSYRLPEGEEITKILDMRMENQAAWSICFQTSAGKIYWHERRADGSAATKLVTKDSAAAEGTLYANAFYLSENRDRLVRFCSDQESLKEFRLRNSPVELTAITAAYTSDQAHDPYEIYVFALEEGKVRFFTLRIDGGGREVEG